MKAYPPRPATCRIRPTRIWLCALFAAAPLAYAAEGDSDSIDLARDMLGQWVETERLISAEKRDLRVAKELLDQRIELVRREIDTINGRIAEAENSIAEADRKRGELLEENKRLKDASASLTGYLSTLESGTTALLKRLPEPLRERVRPLSQRIPKEGAETTLSSAERFQNVVGILNEVNKFNREIMVTSEVMRLDNGSAAEVTALYLGVSMGFYVGSGGTIAGVGRPRDGVWTWTQMNDAAPAIGRSLAILKNEEVAAFVRVPVEIE